MDTFPKKPQKKARWLCSAIILLVMRAVCAVILGVVALPTQWPAGWVSAKPVVAPEGVAALAPAAQTQANTVPGVVFRDVNSNGIREADEPGLAGLVVTVFDASNTPITTTTTLSNGSYLLQGNFVAPLRIELSNLPIGYSAGSYINNIEDTGTLVRFVLALPATINFALSYASDYCQSNPLVVGNCFVFGNQATGPYSTQATLVSFPYQSGTTSLSSNVGVSNPVTHAVAVPAALVGPTFGLAYQRETGLLYAAAFTKRHTGYGPGGTGAIYQINPANNTASVFVNLNTLFPGSAGPDNHNPNNFFQDTQVWDSVGKTALGGLDLSEDGETLWVMNLSNRRLLRLPIGIPPTPPTASAVISYSLPNPGVGAEGCPLHPQTPADALNRNLRPFAVKVRANSVFVGMVCTGESTQLSTTLRAFVYELNVSTGAFAQVANFPLNYTRGCVSSYAPLGNGCNSANWNPWSNTIRFNAFAPLDEYDYAQPMLTDIDFDDAGNMIVALGDRFGHQSGEPRRELGSTIGLDGAFAGDILKLGPSETGWSIEQNARVGAIQTAGANNNQGPGGGEFYYHDNFALNSNVQFHSELTMGGIVVLPNSGEVMASAYNPTPRHEFSTTTLRTTGYIWLNNNTGARTRSYLLIENEQHGYFTKGSGTGDVELLCNSAPMEIGNRVWIDDNANGIQEADEAVAAGVTVRLYTLSGTLLATTQTDVLGRYHFSTAGGDNLPYTSDDIGNYGPDKLPNTADDVALAGFKPSTSRINNRYVVRLDNPSDYLPGGALRDLQATLPNVNSGVNSDERDSDAEIVNGYPTIVFTSPRAGENNAAFDFGLTGPGQVAGRVWVDANHDGVRADTDATLPNVLVTLVGPGTLVLTTTTGQNGTYVFPEVPPGRHLVQFAVPQTYTPTYPLVGAIARDSDVVDIALLRTNTFVLTPRTTQSDIDLGLWKPSPRIAVKAFTNDTDADTPPGPSVPYRSPITWTYFVTNTGDISLTNLVVFDNRLGFVGCLQVLLVPGQSTLCQETGLALAGQYVNVATVFATDQVNTQPITATDLSHYYGTISAAAVLKKYTNGLDANQPPGPAVTAGSTVTWTYVVSNTGLVQLNNVIVVDDDLGNIPCPKTTLSASEAMACVRTGFARVGQYVNHAVLTATYNFPGLSGFISANDISHYFAYAPASIGNLVWLDANNDGQFQDNELPLHGITVTLLAPLAGGDFGVVATTNSGQRGEYEFKNLLPGNYAVAVSVPVGYQFTTPLSGNVATDSDIDPATGRTRILALAAGENNNTIDAGLVTNAPRVLIRATTNGSSNAAAPGLLVEAGAPVNWLYFIYNTGNVPLAQIKVSDDVAGPVNCSTSTLAPNQTLVCSKSGTAIRGQYSSVARVEATYTGAGEQGPALPGVVITSSAPVFYFGGFPSLSLVLTSMPAAGISLSVKQKDVVTYSFAVHNVGTFTASSVIVTNTLPTGLALITPTTGPGPASPASFEVISDELRWTLGALRAGDVQTVTYSALAVGAPQTNTGYVNVGYVASSQTGLVSSNFISHTLSPNAITLAAFSAREDARTKGVVVQWRTGSEVDTFGFALYRSRSNVRASAVLVGDLVQAKGLASGADYSYADLAADAVGSYYWLVEVETDGTQTEYGPTRAEALVVPAATTQDDDTVIVPAPVAVPVAIPQTDNGTLPIDEVHVPEPVSALGLSQTQRQLAVQAQLVTMATPAPQVAPQPIVAVQSSTGHALPEAQSHAQTTAVEVKGASDGAVGDVKVVAVEPDGSKLENSSDTEVVATPAVASPIVQAIQRPVLVQNPRVVANTQPPAAAAPSPNTSQSNAVSATPVFIGVVVLALFLVFAAWALLGLLLRFISK